MEEYVCVTVLSKSGEGQGDFSARLSHCWTGLLRGRPDDFERVYAETTRFEDAGGRWSRQYLVEQGVAAIVADTLRAADIDFEPIDEDDLYSKYEASPPGWMQIEH